MSLVTVQMGQCGNQLGAQFFTSIIDDITSKTGHNDSAYVSAATDRFFYKPDDDDRCLQARAVMVDMEPKVIAKVIEGAQRSGRWTYNPQQQYSQKRGSGNNWAHGFKVHGPKAREPVLELVRREVERCDRLEGFVTLLSLAGGTGSGVGTYITHALRDDYPNAHMLNPVVWPYDSGEVCVQNYNAVLTLAHLYQSSDAIIAVENDHLHQICTRLLALKKVSFSDLNGVFTRQLAAALLPAYEGIAAPSGDTYVRNPLGSVLEHLVAHPSYRLLSLRAIPQQSVQARDFSTYRWPGLMKHLRQMLLAKATMEEGMDWSVKASASHRNFNQSVANLLVLRGNDLTAADASAFSEPHLYTDWVPASETLKIWSHRRPYINNDKFAVLLSNSQTPLEPMNRVIGKAWDMFASRAYVHHYLRHGLTEDEFVNSFACLEQVLQDYAALSGENS